MKHEGVFHGRMMSSLFGSLRGALVAPPAGENVASQLVTEERARGSLSRCVCRFDLVRLMWLEACFLRVLSFSFSGECL